VVKRRWTLVLVPHGSEPSRIVEVSYGVLRMLAGAAGSMIVLALIAGYATISHTTDLSRAARLQQENASLAREVGEMHGRLATLADTLTRISQRDARIRVLANLDPISVPSFAGLTSLPPPSKKPPIASAFIPRGWLPLPRLCRLKDGCPVRSHPCERIPSCT
jgi:hypothetical protein